MSGQSESVIASINLKGNRSCSFELPPEAVRRIEQGEVWEGRIFIKPILPKPPEVSLRRSALEEQYQSKGKFRNIVRATVDERKVIRAWNRSRYIRNQENRPDREPRNYPLAFKEIAETLPLVRKALRAVGLPELIRNMETYFDFCSTGGHIWEGQNHGYKTITGFLERMLVVTKEKKKPWWDVRDTPIRQTNDLHAQLTRRIANSYAQTFMNEPEFPLEQGSKEHVHFIKAAAQAIQYIARKKRQGFELTQTDMIKYLLEFVKDLYEDAGDVVYPAHLASSATWSVIPEYLKDKGVI